MSLDAYEVRSNISESRKFVVRGVGGSSAVTQVSGKGVVLTRTGTGAYLLTFSDAPGYLMGATYGLQATTRGDIAGHTLIYGAWTDGGTTLSFTIYNASDAAHDLAALEWMTLDLTFSPSEVNQS